MGRRCKGKGNANDFALDLDIYIYIKNQAFSSASRTYILIRVKIWSPTHETWMKASKEDKAEKSAALKAAKAERERL